MAIRRSKNHYLNKIRSVLTEGYEIEELTGVIVSSSRIQVKCPVHGWYETSVSTLCQGSLCMKCARLKVAESQRLSREERISQCESVHGKKYDYSYMPSEIVNNKVKVQIVCPEHGMFKQRLNEHLRGKGCLACSKNSSDKAYILEIDDGGFKFLKFGVTKNINRRIQEISCKTKFNVSLIYSCQFKDVNSCLEAEKEIKSVVKPMGVKKLVPEGFTETTHCSNFEFIVSTFKKHDAERI